MSVDAIGVTAPSERVMERLEDPAVADALVRLLDHAEPLAMLVAGLDALLRRGEVITDSLGASLAELRTAGAAGRPDVDLKALAANAGALGRLSGSVAGATPAISQLLESDMLRAEVIELLALFADAAVEGHATAMREHSSVKGVFGLTKALKDPDVQQGLGLLVAISRSLGRKLQDR